jgi:diguanylate cyclase (GGDEF)-like protein
MELDFMTGLYTRKELEYYTEMISKRKNSSKCYGGMMIDIDNFKGINDAYGHDIGDKVLAEVSDAFLKSFRNTDFVSRIGGDEFVAICEVQSIQDLEIIVSRIRNHMNLINEQKRFPFSIQLSIGYDLWNVDHMSKEEFMIHIDKRMYVEKDAKKSKRV